jgi:multidrug efflux system membrane fusion protein
MDQHSPIPPATSRPPRKKRTRVIGGTIAVLSMAALGYLAWTLINPAPTSGPGGPGR